MQSSETTLQTPNVIEEKIYSNWIIFRSILRAIKWYLAYLVFKGGGGWNHFKYKTRKVVPEGLPEYYIFKI